MSALPPNGSIPALTTRPLRSRFRIHGKQSHSAKHATRPLMSYVQYSHSSTLTFAFGFLSLLSMRGSP